MSFELPICFHSAEFGRVNPYQNDEHAGVLHISSTMPSKCTISLTNGMEKVFEIHGLSGAIARICDREEPGFFGRIDTYDRYRLMLSLRDNQGRWIGAMGHNEFQMTPLSDAPVILNSLASFDEAESSNSPTLSDEEMRPISPLAWEILAAQLYPRSSDTV